MSEQTVSAQALVDAKKELLALREIVHQKDAEMSSLHDWARQRDDDTQQLVSRLDAATRDYAAVTEESRQLRDRLRQYEDTLATERAEHSAMLNDLRGESAVVESESARLALERLHKENEELRRREAESTEVVGRLMADVEAGHRGGVHLPTLATTMTTVTYTKEEHDTDVERQLHALRAELEELFGEDISRMKEQMRDHYSATVDQLRRDLAQSDEERSRLAGQTNLWQQQYMALSEQGVSSADIAQRLNEAVADNVLQRQRVSELTAQVEQLNAQLSSSPLLHETSSKLEEYTKEIAEKFGAESHSLRSKVDELQSMLKEASEDRDRCVTRCQTAEQELEAVRQELLSTHNKHTAELQRIESKAASDVGQLTLQLALAKEQLDTLKFAVVEANNARGEMEQALHEKQSQLETVRMDCEQRIELLNAENADALRRLSTDYTKRLEAELAKYEVMKKENEQLQLQSGQMPLNADVLATPSAAVWGASDVDSVVAHLSSQVEKVTRERDSAMQSLQTVYSDRIELQQTIKTLEAERNTLTSQMNQLDAERQSLGEQLGQTHSELVKLKYTTSSHSVASLSSVGTGSIPNMPSVTDEADGHGPDVIDSLRAEFEELQRLRREKDRSSSSSSGVMATSSGINVSSQSEVNVNVNMKSASGTDSAVGHSSSLTEAEEVLKAEETETLKQEYSALCAELVRLREMLVTLQRVDREREQVRSQFELEIRLLRDEMLRRDEAEAAAVTGTVEAVLDDELKKRDAEIDSLKARLATTLSRMEELITEKDQQCASYEHELEEVHEEHDSALRRIDALVQEHNILVGGQVPLSTVPPENVREMPIVIHSEILESVDEDVSPKRVAFENQAKEIESLRGQLHQAALNIEKLSRDRDMLNDAMESNAAELLAGLEKAASENAEQRQMYEKKLAAYSRDVEQQNRKLDAMSAKLEHVKSAHSTEMEKVREECQILVNELSFSNDESNSEQRQELVASRKQCAELKKQLEQTAAEKLSMEQEYMSVLQDVNRENSARVSALREGFEHDLAQAQAYGDHAVQLEEELNQSRQEVAQLKQNLETYEGSGDTQKPESGDLEALQVLQLRINDLTETKDELQQQLSVVTAENERLIAEVETLQSETANLQSQVATLPQDSLHGFSSVDADSFADTSGDSHLFYTPSKSKKTVVEKLKSLQAEKEVLTNMVDRLNAEKEQLKYHLVTGNLPSHVFEADIRHLELSSPETMKSGQFGNSAEVRLIALESEKELLAGMLEKLSCENEQLIALMTPGNDNALDVSYDDCLSDVNNVDDGTSTTLDQSATTSDFDTLHQRTVEQMMHERDTACSELLAIKSRLYTIMELSASADGSEQEMSADSLLAGLKALAHQAVEWKQAASRETISELQSQMAELHCTNESALGDVRKIQFDPSFPLESAGDNQHVADTDTESDALINIAHQLKDMSVGVSSDTTISKITTSQEAVLLESVTEERDKLYHELENARHQLLEVLPYRETMLVDHEQTIESLIDQLNRLIQQKNELEDRAAEKAVEITSEDTDDCVNYLTPEAEVASQDQESQWTAIGLPQSSAAQQRLVSTSVQVDLQTVHIPESRELDSVLQQTVEYPVEEDTKAFDSSEFDRSSKDLSLTADKVDSEHVLVEKVRTLEERLSRVVAERDQLTADLAHVVQECVDLKASRVDSTESTRHFVEGLRHELDTARSDRKFLAEREATTGRQLAEVQAERDELIGKIDALQDALKSALEDRDRSSSGAEAQHTYSTVSVVVPAEMEHGVSEMPKSDERSDLTAKNESLENRVKELEVMRVNLLSEKEAVAEQYGKTVDELKARLVEMQATVESLQSEIGVKSQESDAVVGDLTSRLLASEMEHRRDGEEYQQKMRDLVDVKSACEEKQKIIDELSRRLQSAIDDESSSLATESRLSGSRIEEPLDGGVSELQQLIATLSAVDAKPQTTEQGTVTEDSASSEDAYNVEADAFNVETPRSNESIAALEVKLHTLETEIAAVRLERDELSAKLSDLAHSAVIPGKDADLALVEVGSGSAANRETQSSAATDHEERYLHLHGRRCIAVTDGTADVKNVVEDSAAETDDAAVQTDVSTELNVDDDLQLMIDELFAETCAVREERDETQRKLSLVETCVKEAQDSADARIKELEGEVASVREELHRSQTRYKTLESEQHEDAQLWEDKTEKLVDELHTIIAERNSLSTQLASAKSDLDAWKRSCQEKTNFIEDLQSELVDTVQTQQVLSDELTTCKMRLEEAVGSEISVERDSLSTELASAKNDLDAWKRSCEEKTNFIEDLQSELVDTVQTQQVLSDELTTCKMRLEETAGSETKLVAVMEKCSELEAVLSTVKQERDSVKQESISSQAQLEELRQTTAAMKFEVEDLETQLAALKDENVTLTTNYAAAVDLNNTQAEIESELRSHIEDLEGQVRSMNGRLENAGLKYDALQQSLAGTAADAASKLDSLNSELASAARENSELVQKLEDIRTSHEELKSQLEYASEERNSLVTQLREAESERTELKRRVVCHQEALVNVESLEKECTCLKEENKCLSERCSALELAGNTMESHLDDQQQRTLTLQTENHQLLQTKESLLSENDHLKQQISGYTAKLNTFASNEQLALENSAHMKDKIKGLEADLSAMVVENGALKSQVGRILELKGEVAAIAAERDSASKRCAELEVEIVELRQNVEDLNKQFELTSTEQSETATELTRRCEEAECEVDRLKKFADEKTSCVLDLESALATAQEELAKSQKDRENLSSALASERNAIKEQTAASEAAVSEVRSLSELAHSKSEQLERELALKCEQLKVADDQLLQMECRVQENGDAKVAAEALQSECDELRTLAGACQLEAHAAREKLSAMEALCQVQATEQDELVTERSKLHAENAEMSRRLMSLQEQLERTEADGTQALSQQVLVKQLGVSTTQEEQNVIGGNASTSQHENQISEMNTVKSELETALETIGRLQAQVSSLQVEKESLQQQKQAAEESLNTVSLELAAATSQPDSARRLQQELAGEVRSTQSTDGSEELEGRLRELDDLTEGKTVGATDSAASLASAHSSRTYTKLLSSDVPAVETSTQLTDAVDTEEKVPPGDLSENDASLSAVRGSRTYTKLVVSTNTAACQTITHPMSDKSEIDTDDLYSQISRLQLELEQQKASQSRLIEKLQTDCVDLAKARDELHRKNSLLNEQLKAKTSTKVNTGSMTDDEMLLSELRAEVEAEIKQHYQSAIEAAETEYEMRLTAVQDECDRQVAAAENSARAEVLECSPSETSVVESASSTASDSTTRMSDVISQRDQLRSELAERTKELAELHVEIEGLREDAERQKTSLAAAVTVEPCSDDAAALDPDEERQRVVTNLESQLLMSTEENERLQAKISDLEQEARRQMTDQLSTVRQQIEEQHVTEMKVSI